MRTIQNVHQRTYPVSEDRLAALFATLATEDDRLWPDGWWPIHFDRPLSVGAEGGHGGIAYRVIEFEPGRRVEFAFPDDDVLPGTHALEIITPGRGAGDDDHGTETHRTVLRHTLSCTPAGPRGLLTWSLIRPLHDAVVEDLLDRAGRELGHPPAHPARWSLRVRLLRRLSGEPAPTRTERERLTA